MERRKRNSGYPQSNMPYYEDPITKQRTFIGNPSLNPDLVAGKILVGDTINSDSLSANFDIGSQLSFPKPSPIFPVASLGTDFQTQLTQPETQAQDLSTQLQKLNEQLLGQSTFRAEQEKTAGVSELSKTQADLAGRLKMLQAEALQIPLAIQGEFAGRGVTQQGIRPIESGRLRENAIQALGVAALYEAGRGQLQTALDLVDRQVAQRFDPIKEQIAVSRANLDLILKSPIYTVAERNRAEAQKFAQEQRAVEIAQQEKDAKAIMNFAIEAAKRGAPSSVLAQIQNSATPSQALNLAGFYLGEEFRQEAEQTKFNRDLQEAQFNLSLAKFSEDKRQFGLGYALEQQKLSNAELKNLQKTNPVQAAEATAEVLQGKVDLISSLENHRGLSKAVGPSIPFFPDIGRITPFKVDVFTGDVQDFIAGVQQLVNKETIDTLINLKARGGTLGALSDQERILLQSAATKIGSWQQTDKKGVVYAYNTSEKAFLTELNKIKELALKAKARSLAAPQTQTNSLDEVTQLRQAGYSEEQIKILMQL